MPCRHRVIAVVMGLLAALAVPCLGGPSASKVSVATLNCEFLIKDKVHIKYGLPFKLEGQDKAQWEQPGYRDARFEEAIQAVAKVIAGIDADVIALCEVGDEEDVEPLREAVAAEGVDYPHSAVCDSADATTGQHVAVLSKHPFEQIIRQIPGRESFLVERDDPETEDDTGLSKGMHVIFEARGRRVNVYVVHLASERGGEEKDAQRVAQASIVRRSYLKALQDGEYVVVMGDLNDYRGQPTLRRIRGLDDIFADLIHPPGPAFNKKRKSETAQQYNERIGDHWTYEFAGQKQQIDHVLFSYSIKEECKRGGVKVRFEETDVKIAGTEHPATDHRAVVVEFELK
jgi:endonuclease/exonuclease/phosphatase family metal-dependent hydrolase